MVLVHLTSLARSLGAFPLVCMSVCCPRDSAGSGARWDVQGACETSQMNKATFILIL
jgi:hypothetical protein